MTNNFAPLELTIYFTLMKESLMVIFPTATEKTMTNL